MAILILVNLMAPITDLKRLLKEMKPERVPSEFVFCSVLEERLTGLKLKPIMTFREKDGITLVIRKTEAEANSLPFQGIWALITLTVNSDLSAVGFLAAITAELAKARISVNAVSAFHHDHLFVPLDRADDALRVLERLSNQ
jgi:hypothetical protein